MDLIIVAILIVIGLIVGLIGCLLFNKNKQGTPNEKFIPQLTALPTYTCPTNNGKICSGNGRCNEHQECTCSPGWSDTDCSVIGVNDTAQCMRDDTGQECFGHGNCESSSGVCLCSKGFSGLYCQNTSDELPEDKLAKLIYSKLPSTLRPWFQSVWLTSVEMMKNICKSYVDIEYIAQTIVNNILSHPPEAPLYYATLFNNIAQGCNKGVETPITITAENALNKPPAISPW